MHEKKTKNLMQDENYYSLFTVIIGSFRKHLQQIVLLKLELKNLLVITLSPSGDIARNPDDEFIILNSDPVSHPKLLQDSVFAQIKRSTFLLVANFNGYLGRATALEIGYAIALGIPIYSIEPIDDPHISPYCKLIYEIFPHIQIPVLTKE